ncbi:hypothetical protein Goklo_028994 [Gossypium klotzschianum]|uniref:Uncharacterized protein n=1 Tax=Gossypium klotzschianum TaxID=34286 RepID=A0A7J8W5Y8_9ROSI|nr:hypothetical protein [Gossypium klotzschianum]
MPTVQLFQMMPGAYPNPFMYSSPYMFPFSSPMAGWSPWSGSSLFSVTLSGPFSVGDANTSTVTILSMWLIIPTPTTRSPTGGTRIPARATTTPAESWTKEESSA